MKRFRIRRAALRRLTVLGLTGALGLVMLGLPLDWGRLGRQAAYLVVGLRQPESAAAALDAQLFSRPATEAAEAQAALAGTQWEQNRGDTTRLELPVAAAPAGPDITMTAPPGNKKTGGSIAQRTLTGKKEDGIASVNRAGKTVDIAAALARKLTVGFTDTDAPQVLIVHTHTTEGYMTYDADYYNAGDLNRTRDHKKNVCAAGEAIRLTLEAAGIGVIHDTTVHDDPQYTGAYTRSAATAQALLEKYPSIRVVLDIHRDSVNDGDTVIKPTATVAGKEAAQMMLVTGVVSTDALPHPDWRENLALSAQLQAALDKKSPRLMRPLNTVASRYNQHLSPGWLLVEVGAEGNTVEQAVYAAQLLADALVGLLS